MSIQTAKAARQSIQSILGGLELDGVLGPKSMTRLELLRAAPDDAEWPPVPAVGVHRVKASSFADPADVEAFRRCKAQGNSDQYCFSKGDNGIGKRGDDTTAGSGSRCALPPEDWDEFGKAARGKLVRVTVKGRTVVYELRDTMPHRANIKNGAGIDLNPDAAAALGLRPPFLVDATWEWV